MLKRYTMLTSIFLLLSAAVVKSQTYPSFGQEIDVTINGLTFDAMEPFISADGNYLFFNNINDGVNTKLYYATRVNDSLFTLVGELNGTNQIAPPHLDAVADMDSANSFYWTSTRNYPADLDNLFHGTFSAGNVSNIGRVRGDFNKSIPGWLVMDHGISYDGQLLYYNNARFDSSNCLGPCETEIGIAQKVNDSTFNKIPGSNSILQNINDVNYISYAPCISSDNLELYYARYLGANISVNTLFEICVAVRSTPTGTFSVPQVLFSELIGELIEAPTLSTDKQVVYYHRKITGSHKIVMRKREIVLNVDHSISRRLLLTIYPNPATEKLIVETETLSGEYIVIVMDILGQVVIREENLANNRHEMNIENLVSGVYFIQLVQNGNKSKTIKFIKK